MNVGVQLSLDDSYLNFGYIPRIEIHHRDLLSSIEPIVNNSVLYTKNLAKRIDLMLCSYHNKNNK